MSASESTEFDILESILPRFKAEGFEVFVHPSPSILPPFMHAYRPDAIALSRDKKIAIEVVRQSANSETKIKDLQDLIAQHSDWELRVFLRVGRCFSTGARNSLPVFDRYRNSKGSRAQEE